MTYVIVILNKNQTCQLFLTEQCIFLFCVLNEANQLFFSRGRTAAVQRLMEEAMGSGDKRKTQP